MPRCCQFSEDRKEPSAARSRSATDKLGDIARAENWRNPKGVSSLGHLSASLAHLGNIACRVNRTLHLEASAEKTVGDDEANKHLKRRYRNAPEEAQSDAPAQDRDRGSLQLTDKLDRLAGGRERRA